VRALLLAAIIGAATPSYDIVELPDGKGGIGSDDLRFSPELHRVLVPAGRSGRLDLVDPMTRAVEEIPGFSGANAAARGHSEGTTSADGGDGLVFASDRTRRTLAVVDPRARHIVSEVELGGGPDYVRWVEALREVWVTEPDEQRTPGKAGCWCSRTRLEAIRGSRPSLLPSRFRGGRGCTRE
jgi:hypothetical protein